MRLLLLLCCAVLSSTVPEPSPMVIRCLVAVVCCVALWPGRGVGWLVGSLVRCCVALRCAELVVRWYCARRSGRSSSSGSIAGHNITLRDSVGV